MNPSLKNLVETASKKTKHIIGLMSGTSLDGLDIALCEISGNGDDTEVRLQNFGTVSYDSQTKKRLQTISSVPEASLEEVCLLHSWLGDLHGQLILQKLAEWEWSPADIDCIASHGQTIYHAPKNQHGRANFPNATLQIGDADHIATQTGILTISDFRQKHTAAGGEGAPMVSFVDRMLYTHDTEERILLNIGGIANFTYLPARNNTEQVSITTDTGPGNTLIDAAAKKHFSKDFDKDGAIARRGIVNPAALKAFKADPYFQRPLPKTTGPEVFNLHWINKQLQNAELPEVSPEDLVATLTRLSAETIADSIHKILNKNREPVIYVSGGGIHNPVIMKTLRNLLPRCEVDSFASVGFNPDAKEAVLFAILANETLSGQGFPMNANSTNEKNINFGKISFPC